ncbi:hypothetical protein GE061_004490 [Apolygus lucorum]|uniref:Uncharacterized protein n=1 Tax=Apolygus lucorum TaxID=248454 RepID=A0A6A4IXW5_APOLU|nr:hypothetical protein GE061_004490 [Apolygus lucorum]
MMKFLVFLAVAVACVVAQSAQGKLEEQTRDKRGLVLQTYPTLYHNLYRNIHYPSLYKNVIPSYYPYTYSHVYPYSYYPYSYYPYTHSSYVYYKK